MIRTPTLTVLFAVVALAPASAQNVEFNFDDLRLFEGPRAIGEYMTSAYGSTVSVDSARTTAVWNDADDRFIATSLQLFNRGDFEILFEETPIIGLQFEGYVIDATIGDDFTLTVFNDDLELLTVGSVVRNEGEEVFQSDWETLPAPGNRIVVTDSGRKDVGIDDLIVQPVPDAATGVLVLVGAAALLRRRS